MCIRDSRFLGVVAENIGYAQKMGLVAHNDTGVGRNGHFTLGESIQRVHRNVGRHDGSQDNLDFYLSGGVIPVSYTHLDVYKRQRHG